MANAELYSAVVFDLKSYQAFHDGYEWTYGFAIDSIRKLDPSQQSAILGDMKDKGLIIDNGRPELFDDGSIHCLWRAL